MRASTHLAAWVFASCVSCVLSAQAPAQNPPQASTQPSAQASTQTLSQAKQQAREGKVDAAVASLRNVLSADPRNAEAHRLLCNVYASVDQLDAAIRECESAASLMPDSSSVILDLAHVYGSKADHSGALTGMRMVGKIRSSFERAVQLDGRSVDALSDLGEFYVEAPSIAGGGLDKARALVPRLQAVSPARAHRLAGMIAAKEDNDAAAETEFQAELAVAHSPEAYVDLANFERHRKRYDEAAAAARTAIQKDAGRGGDTVDAAHLLLQMKRDLPVAQDGLRRFLATPHPASRVAPYAKVHTMLGESLQSSGDSNGARAQFSAALALAADYAPAKRALSR